MQIKMSVTNRSLEGQTISGLADKDVVIVKMNMPYRFKIAPGIQSQRELNTREKPLETLLVNKTDGDEMSQNNTQDGFATVTVNLLSTRPKLQEGEEQANNDHDKSNGDANDDVKMQDDDEESLEKEDDKDQEHYDEIESEESENESESVRQTKTPISHVSSHNVTLTPLALPNISLTCHKCSSYVNICHLRSHRDFHTALQTFKYEQHFTPQNLKTLIKRRKILIKKLQESSNQSNGKGFIDKNLQKINTAFEILKSELEGTGNTYRVFEADLNPEINGVYSLEMCCTRAVGLCEESNSRWKHMEDMHAYQDQFLDEQPSCFMGIYDGYCGNVTAQKCAKHLHVFLKEELQERLSLSKEGISTAFKQAYQKFQRMLLNTTEDEEPSRSRWSGCSALTCLLTLDACCLANAGNVGALLVRDNGLVKVLASRHDLYNKKERDRVRRCKGVIVKTEKCALINGALGTTRGLGNIGDLGLNQCIKNKPKFKYVKLVDNDQVIVLASSGLWKMFSYDEVSYLIFGFFRKVKQDIINQIVYGERIPNLEDNGLLANELDNIYERLNDRHEYFKTFLRPKTSSQPRHTSVSVGFRLYNMHTIKEEKEDKTSVRVSLKIPYWTKRLGRRMSDTCLNYQGNSPHGDENQQEKYDDATNEDEEMSGRSCFKRRHSMPHSSGLHKLQQFTKTDVTSNKQDKEKLLAKYLSRRLVKSAILAGSLDNITVFAILLQGFSLVNVHLVSEELLETLDDKITVTL